MRAAGRVLILSLLAGILFLQTGCAPFLRPPGEIEGQAAVLGVDGRVHVPENIRVLILDGDFSRLPGSGEELARLDRVTGRLILKDVNYSGLIEVWRGGRGLYIINELPFEDYVGSVVRAETARGWHPEALKAQAVITRTYALNRMLTNGGGMYHLTSSVLHQLYKGDVFDESVDAAVTETEGEILTYGGKPIEAFYHSTTGGRTELPEEVFGRSLPYLKSVRYDCALSPLCIWARRIPLGEIAAKLELKGDITDIVVASSTATGRVRELEITAGGEPVMVKATELRRRLGWRRLPSTDFSVNIESGPSRADGGTGHSDGGTGATDATAAFEGRGYGHGVGLGQWTSLQMALDGMTYSEILSFFYNGVMLERFGADESGGL